MGFALGIVRVQYRSFIGTGAQRSPKKARPFPVFHGIGERPDQFDSFQLAICFGLSAFTFLLVSKYDTPLKLMQSETFIFDKSLIQAHERFSFF